MQCLSAEISMVGCVICVSLSYLPLSLSLSPQPPSSISVRGQVKIPPNIWCNFAIRCFGCAPIATHHSLKNTQKNRQVTAILKKILIVPPRCS